MKPSSIIACLLIAINVPVAVVVAKPYLEELNAIEKDCVQTPKAQRTPEQVKRCARKLNAFTGFVVYGLL